MITDLKKATLARGLKIHSRKTKVLRNESELRRKRISDCIDIDGDKYEVLALNASTKYLGRKVCYDRIAVA